jgi:hypothetical protein
MLQRGARVTAGWAPHADLQHTGFVAAIAVFTAIGAGISDVVLLSLASLALPQ